jgi:hypothetical protein
MRIPRGVTERIIADVVTNYEVELKHTDYGSVLLGEMEELEKVRDHMVKSMNQLIKELEEGHEKSKNP